MNVEHVLLALETSGKSGSVSVVRANGGQLDCHTEWLPDDAGSAKTLAPAIDRLLKKNNIEMSRLSAIALLTGPGSFTGLRVGVATAKAMAYALRIPTVEIDTLDVIAYQCPVDGSSVHVILDAYRGQVFCSEYAILNTGSIFQIEKMSNTEIVDIDVLLARISKRRVGAESIDFCGPGCARIRKFLDEPGNMEQNLIIDFSERLRWIEGAITTPNAESVGKLAYRKFILGDVLDPFVLQPRYYRGSAAEEVAAKGK